MTVGHTIAHRWGAWTAVGAGVFMATLDSSIVNISLPHIASALHSDLPGTQWVVLSYMVGLATLLIPVGRLSDLVGRRQVYVWGLLLFTLGSFLCGLAHTVAMLIAMRILQAIGAAGVMANGPAIVTEMFEADRGKALGMMGTVVSLGTMTGPSLGGFLLENYGWPWIFWVNVPVGLAMAAYAWRSLNTLKPPRQAQPPFDTRGALWSALSLAGLTLLGTYGLALPPYHPLTLGLVVLTGASLVGFYNQEHHSPTPLMPLPLFKNATLMHACVASFLAFIGITLIFFLCPFYLQQTLHLSPSHAGSILITTAVALSLISPLSGTLFDRFRLRRLGTLGMLISAMALLGISRFDPQTPLWIVILCLMGVGFGNGLFHPPNNVQLLSAVPEADLGVAGGMMAIVRTLGMMFGVALAGFVFHLHHVPLAPSPEFIPTFQTVFQFGAAFTLLNACWLEWAYPKASAPS